MAVVTRLEATARDCERNARKHRDACEYLHQADCPEMQMWLRAAIEFRDLDRQERPLLYLERNCAQCGRTVAEPTCFRCWP